jgi:hypothetical protein
MIKVDICMLFFSRVKIKHLMQFGGSSSEQRQRQGRDWVAYRLITVVRSTQSISYSTVWSC